MQLSLFSPVRQRTRVSQKERVLAMLLNAYRRGEWVTNREFLNAVPWLPNFRSRFKDIKPELKEMGLKISEAEYVRPGVWKYRLVKDGE